jgi:hypothetical protein
LFSEEDRLSSKMKMRMREYNEKVDKCLLPHLGEVLQVLNVEADRMSGDENVSESDMALAADADQGSEAADGHGEKNDGFVHAGHLRLMEGDQSPAEAATGTRPRPLDLGVQEYTS